MDDQLFDPVFVSALIALLVPYVTALIVRYDATSAVKATVATVLAAVEAAMVVWFKANDLGQPVAWKVLVVAVLTAVTAQRVMHAQVVKPYKIAEKLPAGGLIGGRRTAI